VLITGNGFGLNTHFTSVLRIGETASEKTEWKSDTSILTIAAAASGNLGSLKVAVTAQIRAGTTTTALSYDAPSARSVRISGLRVATVDIEMYCPKKYNSIVDMFSDAPLPTLPPVIDSNSASTLENITNNLDEIYTKIQDSSSYIDNDNQANKTQNNRTRLHAFVENMPCVSLKFEPQPFANYYNSIVRLRLVCQLAIPVPAWVNSDGFQSRSANQSAQSRSVSIALFGSNMDKICRKIQRTDETAVCSGNNKPQTLAAICTASASSTTAFEPPRRGQSVRLLALADMDLGVYHISLRASLGYTSAERTCCHTTTPSFVMRVSGFEITYLRRGLSLYT
jgi:hypothetical protein